VESHILTAYIPLRTLWPEGLAIAAGAIYLSGMKASALRESTNWARMRLLSFLGFLACAYLFYLGLYPSIFSIAAVFVIPAPFTFLVLIFRPALISNWPKLHIYLWLCVALSSLCALSEVLWLLHLRLRN
jgi:hypothetical protein